MKSMFLTICFISFILNICLSAQTWVDGYYKSDGTYVNGHFKSSSNDTKLDNYSTKGNYNPFTGNTGNKNPYTTDIFKSTANTSATDIFKSNKSIWHNDVNVRDYQRNNGIKVDSYYRTKPNNTLEDNYSTKWNYNPYTGKKGTIKIK